MQIQEKLFKFTVSLNKNLSSYYEQRSVHKTEMHRVKKTNCISLPNLYDITHLKKN